MKLKNIIWIIPVLCLALYSCFDDKGNYDYHDLDEIEITNIPDEVAVLANAENIVVTPKVVSKEEGEIAANNPAYAFTYYYSEVFTDENGYNRCSVLDSTFSKDLNIPARIPAKKYSCWFEVKDKRTDVVTTHSFTLTVASTITEGWMVLCNEGSERRVRMDMIGVISAGREVMTHDIIPTLPSVHGAVRMGYNPNFNAYVGPIFKVLTEEGGYKLDPISFATGAAYSMDYEYGDPSKHYTPLYYGTAYTSAVVIDKSGDFYCGSIFGMPVNVSKPGATPTFKVSDYVGNISGAPGLFLFNTTDQRFMMWYGLNKEVMTELPPSEPELFDWSIGKDLVYMSGTQNNNGIYALMKDKQGRYCLCGIETVVAYPQKYKQILYQDGNGAGLQVSRLNEAKLFVFHPKLPYLFYAVDNEIWQYDYSTQQAQRMIELDKAEKVTMIKFNVFLGNYRNITKPDEYFAKQYRLIVGSVDSREQSPNNGKLRFYDVPELNGKLVQYGETYGGFAEIADVVYRESQ